MAWHGTGSKPAASTFSLLSSRCLSVCYEIFNPDFLCFVTFFSVCGIFSFGFLALITPQLPRNLAIFFLLLLDTLPQLDIDSTFLFSSPFGKRPTAKYITRYSFFNLHSTMCI